MKEFNSGDGIWFVYDGECPLCTWAALALRIKAQYGELHLLDARASAEHELLQAIHAEGLDLDEGMVIYDGQRFYHGQAALRFMARFGETKGLFNLTNKLLFWSEWLAKITYPWMRGARNWLLRRRGIQSIDNLGLKNEPIFKRVFQPSWDELPSVMQKHYACRPYSDDEVIVDGILDVSCSGPIKIFAPILGLLGNIPPYSENNVPVTVSFNAEKDSKAFGFRREFHFSERRAHVFHSRMFPQQDGEVIELMRFGLGWRARVFWDDGRVKLRHKGYVFRLFGHFFPLPITVLLGEGNAEEWPLDDNRFSMFVDIRHPWWGKIYEYRGQFTIRQSP